MHAAERPGCQWTQDQFRLALLWVGLGLPCAFMAHPFVEDVVMFVWQAAQ